MSKTILLLFLFLFPEFTLQGKGNNKYGNQFYTAGYHDPSTDPSYYPPYGQANNHMHQNSYKPNKPNKIHGSKI